MIEKPDSGEALTAQLDSDEVSRAQVLHKHPGGWAGLEVKGDIRRELHVHGRKK